MCAAIPASPLSDMFQCQEQTPGSTCSLLSLYATFSLGKIGVTKKLAQRPLHSYLSLITSPRAASSLVSAFTRGWLRSCLGSTSSTRMRLCDTASYLRPASCLHL